MNSSFPPGKKPFEKSYKTQKAFNFPLSTYLQHAENCIRPIKNFKTF